MADRVRQINLITPNASAFCMRQIEEQVALLEAHIQRGEVDLGFIETHTPAISAIWSPRPASPPPPAFSKPESSRRHTHLTRRGAAGAVP